MFNHSIVWKCLLLYQALFQKQFTFIYKAQLKQHCLPKYGTIIKKIRSNKTKREKRLMILKTDLAYTRIVQPVVLLSVPRGGAEFTWHDRARMNQERKTLFPTVLCARSHFDPRQQFNALQLKLNVYFSDSFIISRVYDSRRRFYSEGACEDFTSPTCRGLWSKEACGATRRFVEKTHDISALKLH